MDQNTHLELLVLEAQAEGLAKLAEYQLLQLEATRLTLKRTCTRIASIKNPYTPIYALPNELWLQIVKMAQQPDPNPNAIFATPESWAYIYPLEMTMSHVSRRWRDIVISAPTLWTRIGDFAGQHYLELWLTRSRSCPIDITLLRPSESEYEARLATIVRHVDRLQELDISFGQADQLLRLSKVLEPLYAPKLKVLRIRCQGNYERISLFDGGAPLLSVLDLDGCLLVDSSNLLPSITAFRHSYIPDQSRWDNFILAVSHMTLLTRLEFVSMGLPDGIDDVPLEIPSLRHLILDNDSFSEQIIPMQMLKIRAPSLESIVVTKCHGDQIIELFNRLGKSLPDIHPHLKSLSFISHGNPICACGDDYLPPRITADAIHAFASISHLSLINICHQDIILRMLLRDSAEFPPPLGEEAFNIALPRLESITTSPILDAEALGNLYNFRWTFGNSISRLRITKDDFSKLSSSKFGQTGASQLEVISETELLGSLLF